MGYSLFEPPARERVGNTYLRISIDIYDLYLLGNIHGPWPELPTGLVILACNPVSFGFLRTLDSETSVEVFPSAGTFRTA